MKLDKAQVLEAISDACLRRGENGGQCCADCNETIAAISALPSEAEGVVVANAVTRASTRCLIIDCDPINNMSLYFDFDTHPELKAMAGKRVRVVIEPLGESNA